MPKEDPSRLERAPGEENEEVPKEQNHSEVPPRCLIFFAERAHVGNYSNFHGRAITWTTQPRNVFFPPWPSYRRPARNIKYTKTWLGRAFSTMSLYEICNFALVVIPEALITELSIEPNIMELLNGLVVLSIGGIIGLSVSTPFVKC